MWKNLCEIKESESYVLITEEKITAILKFENIVINYKFPC